MEVAELGPAASKIASAGCLVAARRFPAPFLVGSIACDGVLYQPEHLFEETQGDRS